MKRWQLTLALALLAGAGVAVAGSIPALGLGLSLVAGLPTAPEPATAPATPPAPAAVADLLPATPDVIATPAALPVDRPLPRADDGPHPIHTDPSDGEPAVVGIPETQAPPPADLPPIRLPPDLLGERDGCPACGMG